MTYEPSHIADLLLRLHRDNLSDPLSDMDRQELEAWALESAANAELYRELTEENSIQEGLRLLETYEGNDVRRLMLERMPDAFGSVAPPLIGLGAPRTVSRWLAAAVIFAVLGTGVWWWQSNRTHTPTTQPVAPADVAAPAHNRATLTLASGRQVVLDSTAVGAVGTQGGAHIIKAAGGGLTYQIQGAHPAELLYNTLTNPRGSQVVNLTLSDGTKVWLNAESSIRYPAAFVGEERKVEVAGEAYFEVAKSAAKPFKVLINDKEEIEVLGTSFNVNAYEDEPTIKTTLLEGSVRVMKKNIVGVNTNNDKVSVVLKPGQQAQLGASFNIQDDADVDEAVAWKNGLFSFAKADLPTVMRQLERWYDVQVVYEGTMPARSFNGEIGKKLTLDQLLKVLSTTTRVHYTIEGKKLTIQP